MIFGILIWRYSLSFAYTATLFLVNFLVELLHDMLQYSWYHTYGTPLGNKLLNDSFFDALLLASAIRENDYSAPIGKSLPPQIIHHVRLLIRPDGPVAAKQSRPVATALLCDNFDLDAIFSILAARAKDYGIDAGFSELNAPQCPSFSTSYEQRGHPDLISAPILSPAYTVKPARYQSSAASCLGLGQPKSDAILKELQDKLGGLSTSKALPGTPVTFKYLHPFKGGFVLIGFSNSTFPNSSLPNSAFPNSGFPKSAPKSVISFCVYAPTTPAPSSSGVGRGKAGAGRRTGAGVKGRGGRGGGRGGRVGKGIGIGPGGGEDTDDKNDKNDKNDSNDPGDNADSDDGSGRPIYYACPFYKFDPIRHIRCYRKYELRRYSDVKQHILRCHALERLYCSTCWRTWRADHATQWNEHVRSRQCQLVPEPEHLLPQEAMALNELAFGHIGDAEKWYIMWDLLFEGHERPDSPYMNGGLGDFLWILTACGEQLMQQLPSLLVPIHATVDQPQALHTLAQQIHAIYSFPFTPNQPRAERYRRQASIDQQQQIQQLQQARQAQEAQQQIQQRQQLQHHQQTPYQAQQQLQHHQQTPYQAQHIDPAIFGQPLLGLDGIPTLEDMGEDELDQFLNANAFDYDAATEPNNFMPGAPLPPQPPPPPPPPPPQPPQPRT